MAIDNLLTDVRSLIMLISFATFLGIVWWAYSARRRTDFAQAAYLPFADDEDVPETAQKNTQSSEKHHG